MGLFTRGTYENAIPEEDIVDVEVVDAEDVINDEQLVESYKAILEAMNESDVEETEVEAKIEELQSEGAGEEEIAEVEAELEKVTEASAQEVLGKIKEFFNKLMAKVKGFVEGVKKFSMTLALNAKQFLDKYKKQITEAKIDADFKVSVYELKTIDSFEVDVLKAVKALEDQCANISSVDIPSGEGEEAAAKIKADTETIQKASAAIEEALIKKLTNNKTNTKAGMKKHVLEAALGDKVEKTFANGGVIVNEMEMLITRASNYKKLEQKLKSAEGKGKRALQSREADIKRSVTDVAVRNALVADARLQVNTVRNICSIFLTATGAYKSAVSRTLNGYKVVASKAISYKPAKKSK